MKILNQLFTGDKYQAYNEIMHIYHKQGSCVVNYLYFANIVQQGLINKDNDKDKTNNEYLQALKYSDVLLPDGIALQLLYRRLKARQIIDSNAKWLHNLNGTDFIVFFLKELIKTYPDAQVILFGGHRDYEKPITEFATKLGCEHVHYVDGYQDNIDLDEILHEGLFKKLLHIIKEPQPVVLLNSIGFPRSVLRPLENKKKIKKHNLIVFGQGGTFDFWGGYEKRAPWILRKTKLERLRRFLIKPKKNFKKVIQSFSLFKYLFFPHYLDKLG